MDERADVVVVTVFGGTIASEVCNACMAVMAGGDCNFDGEVDKKMAFLREDLPFVLAYCPSSN